MRFFLYIGYMKSLHRLLFTFLLIVGVSTFFTSTSDVSQETVTDYESVDVVDFDVTFVSDAYEFNNTALAVSEIDIGGKQLVIDKEVLTSDQCYVEIKRFPRARSDVADISYT